MAEKKMTLYRTSDIYFGSYLMSIDVPLMDTEKQRGDDGGRRVVFVFKVPESEIGRMKAAYFGGSGTVRARKYVDNLRNLKSLCFT